MTEEKHFCPKCDEVVTPIRGEFYHRDLGWQTCFRCPKCKTMVYLGKVKDEKETV